MVRQACRRYSSGMAEAPLATPFKRPRGSSVRPIIPADGAASMPTLLQRDGQGVACDAVQEAARFIRAADNPGGWCGKHADATPAGWPLLQRDGRGLGHSKSG